MAFVTSLTPMERSQRLRANIIDRRIALRVLRDGPPPPNFKMREAVLVSEIDDLVEKLFHTHQA